MSDLHSVVSGEGERVKKLEELERRIIRLETAVTAKDTRGKRVAHDSVFDRIDHIYKRLRKLEEKE